MTTDMVTCPVCKGRGEVEVGGSPNDAWGYDREPCEFCEGSGEITSVQYIEWYDVHVHCLPVSIEEADDDGDTT